MEGEGSSNSGMFKLRDEFKVFLQGKKPLQPQLL